MTTTFTLRPSAGLTSDGNIGGNPRYDARNPASGREGKSSGFTDLRTQPAADV
jgi:hypothetical protein